MDPDLGLLIFKLVFSYFSITFQRRFTVVFVLLSTGLIASRFCASRLFFFVLSAGALRLPNYFLNLEIFELSVSCTFSRFYPSLTSLSRNCISMNIQFIYRFEKSTNCIFGQFSGRLRSLILTSYITTASCGLLRNVNGHFKAFYRKWQKMAKIFSFIYQ